MKNRFRIDYLRPGVIFEPKYASTIKGAVRVARKHGWGTSEYSYHAPRPDFAIISERVGTDRPPFWEKVAIVSANGITAEDNQSRRSYRAACLQRDEAEAVIKSTYMTMVALNGIADKEA